MTTAGKIVFSLAVGNRNPSQLFSQAHFYQTRQLKEKGNTMKNDFSIVVRGLNTSIIYGKLFLIPRGDVLSGLFTCHPNSYEKKSQYSLVCDISINKHVSLNLTSTR